MEDIGIKLNAHPPPSLNNRCLNLGLLNVEAFVVKVP